MSHTDDIELFNKLKKRPTIAWPTIIVLILSQAAIAFSWYSVINGEMALWQGCIINGISMYFLFSPIHDAMHNAVSTNYKVNEWVLTWAVQPIIPLSTAKFLKMMHMQHHRFGNDAQKDPDFGVAGDYKGMFFRWFFWDAAYMNFYARNKEVNNIPRMDKRIRIENILIWTVALSVAVFYPLEVIFLWLLPSRIMAWLIAAVFMYLPHIPHNTTHAEDPYKATNNRYGWEWLLTPLMAYQNYHLVHHLYPTVPFYRYRKIWNARRAFHESHDPLIVEGFKFQPRNPAPDPS